MVDGGRRSPAPADRAQAPAAVRRALGGGPAAPAPVTVHRVTGAGLGTTATTCGSPTAGEQTLPTDPVTAVPPAG